MEGARLSRSRERVIAPLPPAPRAMALSKLSGDVHSVSAGDWDAASERLARLDLTARRSCRAPRWRTSAVMVL